MYMRSVCLVGGVYIQISQGAVEGAHSYYAQECQIFLFSRYLSAAFKSQEELKSRPTIYKSNSRKFSG